MENFSKHAIGIMLVSTSAILDEYSSSSSSFDGSSSPSSSSSAGVVREALQEDELYQDPKQVHIADEYCISSSSSSSSSASSESSLLS
jgi:hypothetical protein